MGDLEGNVPPLPSPNGWPPAVQASRQSPVSCAHTMSENAPPGYSSRGGEFRSPNKILGDGADAVNSRRNSVCTSRSARGKKSHRVLVPARNSSNVALLERNDVGVRLPDDLRNSLDPEASVLSESLVDIVRHHDDC